MLVQHKSETSRVLTFPLSSGKKTYGTTLQFGQYKAHYVTEVSLASSDMDSALHRFLVNRKQVYINNQAPSLTMEQLADNLGKILYPVVLEVDEDGCLRRVANQEQIEERWVKEKVSLERYYKGDLAGHAIREMEQSIFSNNVLSGLRNDWFLALYFSGIYGLKAMDFRQATVLSLPASAYAPSLSFAVTREITEQHTENGCLVIACQGQLTSASAAEYELLERQLLLQPGAVIEPLALSGSTQIRYRLYHAGYGIRSITGSCCIVKGQQEEHTYFEIFERR